MSTTQPLTNVHTYALINFIFKTKRWLFILTVPNGRNVIVAIFLVLFLSTWIILYIPNVT